MKLTEIECGTSYLFYKTHVKHRKFMEGTIVTVSGFKKGRATTHYHSGIVPRAARRNTRIKLTNGHYANPAELKPLSND